jgi:hypothetical protein
LLIASCSHLLYFPFYQAKQLHPILGLPPEGVWKAGENSLHSKLGLVVHQVTI